MAMNIQDIINMIKMSPNSIGQARQISPAELQKMKMAGQIAQSKMFGMELSPDEQYRRIMQAMQPVNPSEAVGQVSDIEAQKLAQAMANPEQAAMGANPALSLPAAEGMPNYANNEMPLYTGGLLQNPQGQMVDPQQLLNTAYDMSAPREMRANAIERLRALGVI